MEFDNTHFEVNKILNRKTNKKEENISDTYILASNKLRELYGDKTILFLQVGSFYEIDERLRPFPTVIILSNCKSHYDSYY